MEDESLGKTLPGAKEMNAYRPLIIHSSDSLQAQIRAAAAKHRMSVSRFCREALAFAVAHMRKAEDR